MPKLVKGSPEAIAFGQKMRLAREAKKREKELPQTPAEAPALSSELLPVEKPTEILPEAPTPMVAEILDIIRRYFPVVPVKIIDRGNSFVVEIIVKEGDLRSFVVSRQMVLAETERWCQRIKANMEGKSLNDAAGIELMVGPQGKPIPSNIGEDKEFFFREE